jgi:hypothetical protein
MGFFYRGELLAKEVAGPLQACADSAFRYAKNLANLAGIQLIAGREDQRKTEFLRKGVDHVVDANVLVGKDRRPLRAGIGRRRLVCAFVPGFAIQAQYFGMPRPAIDCNAPRGARQECAFVFDVPPGAIAIEFQERLLNCIFRILAVEQYGVSDPEHETRLALNQFRELRFFADGQGVHAPFRRSLKHVKLSS